MSSNTVEDVKKRLAKKAALFKKVFESPDGQAALNVLREEFDALNIFVHGDPHGTSYKLGSRDVVKYIEQLVNYTGDSNNG